MQIHQPLQWRREDSGCIGDERDGQTTGRAKLTLYIIEPQCSFFEDSLLTR